MLALFLNASSCLLFSKKCQHNLDRPNGAGVRLQYSCLIAFHRGYKMCVSVLITRHNIILIYCDNFKKFWQPKLVRGDEFWLPKLVRGDEFWLPKVVRGTTFGRDHFWHDRPYDLLAIHLQVTYCVTGNKLGMIIVAN